MNVTFDMDDIGQTKRIEDRVHKAQLALDQQIAKDSNYYAPEDKGDLKDSVYASASEGKGELIWDKEYAMRLYHGVNFNFSKDRNPNARAKWFEAAKSTRLKAWEKTVNAEYNS